MNPRRLTDEDIGQALLRPRGDPHDCVDDARLWDLALGTLDSVSTGRILDHALECPDTSLALRLARETLAASGITPESPGPMNSSSAMWARLAGSVLAPAAALAYLLLLLVSFPVYRFLTTTAPAGPAAPSRVIELVGVGVLRLTGDLSMRGGGAPSAPLRIHLGETESLVLKLFPDVDDLPKDTSAALAVRVLDGSALVAAATRHVGELEGDESFALLLDRAVLRLGTTYTVELTAEPPHAAPVSPILRQSFRLEKD